MKIFLILFFLLSTFLLSQELISDSDSTKLIPFEKKNTVELSKKISKKDTIYIIDAEQNKRWFKNYETLIGAFLSGLVAASIAVFSIYKTNKNNVKLEQDKYQRVIFSNQSRYCGSLFSLFSELITHTLINNQKLNEIKIYTEKVVEFGDLIVDEPFNPFPIEFLKEGRGLLLDFGEYRSSILGLLSAYINKSIEINNFFKLNRVKQSKRLFSNEDEYIKAIQEYFNEVLNHLERLKSTRFELIDDILYEIKSFNQYAYFRTNIEQMINIISHFEITQDSFDLFRKAKIPDEDLKKLEGLKNIRFDNHMDFINELTKFVGEEVFENYKDDILKHSRGKTYNEI